MKKTFVVLVLACVGMVACSTPAQPPVDSGKVTVHHAGGKTGKLGKLGR